MLNRGQSHAKYIKMVTTEIQKMSVHTSNSQIGKEGQVDGWLTILRPFQQYLRRIRVIMKALSVKHNPFTV